MPYEWRHLEGVPSRGWTCGHCGLNVGGNLGYASNQTPPMGPAYFIYPCPRCDRPTFFAGDIQVPGVAFGRDVEHLPDEVAALYREARNCVSVNAFTSAVLACRKLLMHVAVAQGASAGQSFVSYVDHLAEQGYVPPTGRRWVDHIRKKGNEANHEIVLMNRAEAESLLTFIEMLLELVFEFPAKVP